MKNILLITSLYPADDIQFKNNTAVCHYFAKEWQNMGYNVRVINLYNEYPVFFYPLLKLGKHILADRAGIAILDKRLSKEHNYELDGIKVTRIPIYKMLPHGEFSEPVIRKTADRIHFIVQEEYFLPDYILGHFISPSIRVVAALKEKYPSSITTTSLHGKIIGENPNIKRCLPNIDLIGFRSFPIKDSFELIYGKKDSFMCMSGVPAEYITENERAFNEPVKKYIYVGAFMRRKYPSALIPAISSNYPGKDFQITYVGDGNGLNDVKNVAKCYGVTKNIKFAGRVPRSEINSLYDAADVFVMISKKETFGLVWLEAMARGCITIASREEGMDGVIVDGVNGFLCNAGDTHELEQIIARILNMDQRNLQTISRNAITTARQMTDSKMACEYLRGISNKLK